MKNKEAAVADFNRTAEKKSWLDEHLDTLKAYD